jgi:predicted  nucleic acid-binding Zn-ribbon protein
VPKNLQNLLDLQQVDIRLTDVRVRLAKFPKKLAESDARIAAAKATLDTSKAAQLANVKDRKKYELDVESWKDRVRKYRDQTSQVKTNEAYRALQREVELAEQEIAKAEDRLLEQMVASEEFDRRIKAADAALKDVEQVERVLRSTGEADRAIAEKELAELNAERARSVSEVPENLLDHYDRIVKKHHGVALAEVRDEKCGACGMIVRPHVIQEMRRADSDQLFHCETCTRILYYIEPSVSSASVASASQAGAAASSNTRSTSHES